MRSKLASHPFCEWTMRRKRFNRWCAERASGCRPDRGTARPYKAPEHVTSKKDKKYAVSEILIKTI